MLYNYYKLAVQQWCSSSNLIHGLWPDINQTSYPEYCPGPMFDLELLRSSDRYTEIAEYWVDCTESDTIELYEHEWNKHGTCVAAMTGFSQNEYFEKALELYYENTNGGCYDLDFVNIDC
jgi:ribonuclease T2